MPQSPMADRLIRLACTEQNVLVIPPHEAQPFPVPQFPTSQLVWLDHVASVFMRNHQRCLCVALMLDLTRRAWVRPEIPTQQCASDGVRWAWQFEDFTGRSPSIVVAGSFQSAVLRDLDETIALVPPTDGVHLISVKGASSRLHAYVHADGQTLAIEAHRLIIDDVFAALESNANRLTLD